MQTAQETFQFVIIFSWSVGNVMMTHIVLQNLTKYVVTMVTASNATSWEVAAMQVRPALKASVPVNQTNIVLQSQPTIHHAILSA